MSPPGYAPRFGLAVAYLLGSKDERFLALLCPKCAADRMAVVSSAGDQISYVETVKTAGMTRRCDNCRAFPLAVPACELLKPRALLDFIGRVLKMAEREAKLEAIDLPRARPPWES